MALIGRTGSLLAIVAALAAPANGQDYPRLGGPFARVLVLNAPFSAEATTRVQEVAPDGTARLHTVTARYYRDSQGQARAEVDTPWGPYVVVASQGPERVEFYVLDLTKRTYRNAAYGIAADLFNGEDGVALPIGKVCFEYQPRVVVGVVAGVSDAERLRAVNAFMAKIVANDFGGLPILALYGYGLSGAKVARSMFEASVNAAYLAKHPECVDDYIDFHVVAKKKFYDHLLKYDAAAAKAIGAEKGAAMETEHAQVSHRFKKHKNSWTAVSIADRAEEVGSGDLYRLVYSTLSGIAHGDIIGMQTHATSETVDVEPAPSEQWIHESLVLGHAAVAKVFHTYNEGAALSMNTPIDAIHAGFNAAWPSQKRDATSQAIHHA